MKIKANCNEVRLLVVFSSHPLMEVQTKDQLSEMATPNVIHQFTCNTSQKRYFGLIQRRLKDRALEHTPTRIFNSADKEVMSSVTEHIYEGGHKAVSYTHLTLPTIA